MAEIVVFEGVGVGWITFSTNFRGNEATPTNGCCRQKTVLTKVPGLSRGVGCVILDLAILVEPGRTDTR